jgi:hypothetical protein
MTCPCQLGTCGACARGEHAKCLTVQHGGPRPMAHTYLRSGFVLTKVYAGCRYLCPCGCRDEQPVKDVARKPLRRKRSVVEQDALF